jgi:hypothetical protein
MKDRAKMKTTMQDHATNKFGGEKTKSGIIMPSKKVIKSKKVVKTTPDQDYDQLDKDIIDYNNKVTTLDKDYKEFTPFTGIIVRAFHKEMQKDPKTGLVISAPTTIIPDMGVQGAPISKIASPWAFSRKAIIVAVPENFETYKPGEIVQLSLDAILVSKMHQGDFRVIHGFTLWEYQDFQPPTSKKDKHYGYFLIDPYKHIHGRISSN